MKADKVLEETQKKIRHRWKFVEGRERIFVYAGFSVSFILIMVMIIVLYNGVLDRYLLQMKFDSEKSFNSIYMAMNDSSSKAESAMSESGVSGIGIYSSSGYVYVRLGDAPPVIPLSKLVDARRSGQDSTLGIYIMDGDNDQIEYFRLSRLNVVLETGSVFQRIPENSLSSYADSDFPDIIYVKFDGSQYFSRVRRARVMTVAGVIMITIIFLTFLSIYIENRKYRLQLQRNESLIKLGAAARTLTHEIKNPLSAMTIQSALMRKLLPADFRQDLDVMDHEIARLTNLTNRVSEFLKNPTGNPVDIELVRFIGELARLFAYEIPVNSDCESVTVSIDPDKCRSIFENLIRNAVESCEGRDPQVSVEISCKHRNVTVKILDRGDGLPKQTRQSLFDPFFTTKIHGSGIGLSISKQFVEARGGTLKLYDRDGGGTVAEVNLPTEV